MIKNILYKLTHLTNNQSFVAMLIVILLMEIQWLLGIFKHNLLILNIAQFVIVVFQAISIYTEHKQYKKVK
jgi:hypothetical protein